MDGYTPIWPPRPATWRDHIKAAAYVALEVVSLLGCVAGIIAVFVVAFAP